MIKRVTMEEFMALFADAETQRQIKASMQRFPDATGVVCFENQDMCSSHLGHRSAMIVGPSNTYTGIDVCDGHHLGDLPSRFQWPTVAVELKPRGPEHIGKVLEEVLDDLEAERGFGP